MHEVFARRATLDDSQDIFSWRNDPLTIQMSRNAQSVEWSSHDIWYKTSLASNLRMILVCEVLTCLHTLEDLSIPQKVGMVRFDLIQGDVPSACEVSINLNPRARGLNLGSECISRSLAFMRNSETSFAQCNQIIAQIKASNIGSQKVFSKAGFCGATEDNCATRDNILIYSLSFED